MTEAEWLTCVVPGPMLEQLAGHGTYRKRVLLALSWCDRIWDLLFDNRSREALQVTRQWLEGTAKKSQLFTACEAAWETMRDLASEHKDAARAASGVLLLAWDKRKKLGNTGWPDGGMDENPAQPDCLWAISFDCALASISRRQTELEQHCALIRDIFGNPFRPVTVNPACLTSDVTGIAQAS